MRLLSLARVAALLVAAAFLLPPGAVAETIHPLDPAAPAGVLPTQNAFESLVPLLDRDRPVPSFAGEADTSSSVVEDALPSQSMPMEHGSMEHGAMDHAVPLAEAPQ